MKHYTILLFIVCAGIAYPAGLHQRDFIRETSKRELRQHVTDPKENLSNSTCDLTFSSAQMSASQRVLSPSRIRSKADGYVFLTPSSPLALVRGESLDFLARAESPFDRRNFIFSRGAAYDAFGDDLSFSDGDTHSHLQMLMPSSLERRSPFQRHFGLHDFNKSNDDSSTDLVPQISLDSSHATLVARPPQRKSSNNPRHLAHRISLGSDVFTSDTFGMPDEQTPSPKVTSPISEQSDVTQQISLLSTIEHNSFLTTSNGNSQLNQGSLSLRPTTNNEALQVTDSSCDQRSTQGMNQSIIELVLDEVAPLPEEPSANPQMHSGSPRSMSHQGNFDENASTSYVDDQPDTTLKASDPTYAYSSSSGAASSRSVTIGGSVRSQPLLSLGAPSSHQTLIPHASMPAARDSSQPSQVLPLPAGKLEYHASSIIRYLKGETKTLEDEDEANPTRRE